ncbi:rac GTPase-activating protein 1 isoform X2 [Betta splendens]|nr:rac GTPase-activating protein 1 isoform X2 [Betta splendens]
MRKRYKMEADYHYLERQMQLMCDILIHDSKSSSCLNDEQKTLLAAFDHKGANATLHKSSRRLSVIDESSFLSHSDISYDRTDDDVDFDTTVLKPLRSRARERRRSSMGPAVGALVRRRRRGSNVYAEVLDKKPVNKEPETIVKASVVTPESGRQIHMVVGILHESGPPVHKAPQEREVSLMQEHTNETSVWSHCDDSVMEVKVEDFAAVPAPSRAESRKHVFVSKTVIMPETCLLCKKRVRFGKIVVKCRDCRVVAHPECQQKLSESCWPMEKSSHVTAPQDSLEALAPVTHPSVPALVRQCVTEIERRGLQEKGLYRIPGGERLVKELRDQFIQGKNPVLLSNVQDVHVVCGCLKDFLRKLKEPIIPFRLHKTFMEAAELNDDDNRSAKMYQAIAELPKANKDTLAFLMLHFYRVMRSPHCQMDRSNLARVFAPTIVGYGMSEPTPTTILRDTNVQLKVMCHLLSLPEDSWRRVLTVTTDHTSPSTCKTTNLDGGRVPACLFQPLTSPELSPYIKTCRRPGTGRINTVLNIEPGKKFFTSPS